MSTKRSIHCQCLVGHRKVAPAILHCRCSILLSRTIIYFRGLNLAIEMLGRSSSIGNGQIVIVMGRGSYAYYFKTLIYLFCSYEQFSNCCPHPHSYAEQLKSNGAILQGVVLGRRTDPDIMTNLTGRPNIFPGPFSISLTVIKYYSILLKLIIF